MDLSAEDDETEEKSGCSTCLGYFVAGEVTLVVGTVAFYSVSTCLAFTQLALTLLS